MEQSGINLNSFISDDKNKLTYDAELEIEFVSLLAGESEFMPEILEILLPDDLYMIQMQNYYKWLCDTYNKNGKYDIVMFFDFVQNKDGSDALKIVKNAIMAALTITADSMVSRAKIIKKYSLVRKTKKIAAELVNADTENVTQNIETALQELTSTTMQSLPSELHVIGDIIIDYYNSKFSGNNLSIVKTNYAKLDENLPMAKGDFIVIAARPGKGKSAFAINLALKMAWQNKVVSLFSLEMSKEQILNRVFASIGQIPHGNLKHNNVKNFETQMGKAADLLLKKPLFISDNTQSRMTVQEIKRLCRKNHTEVAIIDYLQLITPTAQKKNSSRTEDVSEITRELKIMAGELNMLVIGLSQLNRAVEGRQNPRPIMADLRESGSIEQDANSIIFLFDEKPNTENSRIAADIAKNRDGSNAIIMFDFDRQKQTFRESAAGDYVPPSKKKESEDFKK